MDINEEINPNASEKMDIDENFIPEKDEDSPKPGAEGVIIRFHRRGQSDQAAYRQIFVQNPIIAKVEGFENALFRDKE